MACDVRTIGLDFSYYFASFENTHARVSHLVPFNHAHEGNQWRLSHMNEPAVLAQHEAVWTEDKKDPMYRLAEECAFLSNLSPFSQRLMSFLAKATQLSGTAHAHIMQKVSFLQAFGRNKNVQCYHIL